MKNTKKILIIGAICILVIAIVVAVLAKNNKSEVEQQGENLKNEIDNVMNQIEETGKENSKVNVGKYVIPDETDLVCEEVEGGVRLTSYTGEETTIELPEQIDGKDLVEIGGGAFNSVKLVGIKLPDTVKTIKEKAFFFHGYLVEVRLGKNTEVIEKEAFEGCSALKTINLPKGLVTIGERAFAMTNSLEKIEIPNTVETIEKGAFVISGLKSLRIPSSVKIMGEQAFSTCSSLETVIIEEGLAKIERRAFESCKALTKIEIPESVKEFDTRVFLYCDKVTIYASEGSKAQEYAQEEGIEFKAK